MQETSCAGVASVSVVAEFFGERGLISSNLQLVLHLQGCGFFFCRTLRITAEACGTYGLARITDARYCSLPHAAWARCALIVLNQRLGLYLMHFVAAWSNCSLRSHHFCHQMMLRFQGIKVEACSHVCCLRFGLSEGIR